MSVVATPRSQSPALAPTVGAVAGWRSATPQLACAVVVALIALGSRLPELDRYTTIDESRWVGRAADFATYIDQRDLDKTYLVGHPGVSTMWLGALSMGPERVREFSYLEGQTDVTRREGYLEALVAARMGPLVANAIALGALVWLGWTLFGGGPALVGGLLIALDPFLSAHGRLIHLDALLTSFMSLAALASIAFWGGRSWLYLLVAGLATGLALLTKAPSVYLLAFVPALALVELVRSGRWRSPPGWARLVGGLTLWLGLAGLVAVALWPALRLKPLAVVSQMVDFTLKNGGGERDNYFLGQPVEDPGALFYPLAFLFRATPLMLLGLALLVYFLARRRQRLSSFWPALLTVGYVAGFVLMMTLGQKKFDRYALPIFPPLDLLAGLGLWLGWKEVRRWVAARSEARRSRDGRAGRVPGSGPIIGPYSAALALTVALLMLAAWPLASVYPYQLAYYNPLLGGGRAAQWVLFVGWGEGLDQVAAYLNAKPIVFQEPTAATAYHRVLQAHLRGNNAMPLERAELADYVVAYVNSIQRDQKSELLRGYLADQEPEQVVWINGIEYARVYRGPRLPIERASGAEFGGRARLESFSLAPGFGPARAGDEVLLRLRWTPRGDLGDLTQVIRLVGPDGRATLFDRQPLAPLRREGSLLVSDTRLALPNGLPPGAYALTISLEAGGSGAGLPLASGETAAPLERLRVERTAAR